MQKTVIRGIIQTDRLRREEALELAKAVGRVLNLPESAIITEQAAMQNAGVASELKQMLRR
jgi:hypothetical protein